MSCVGIGVENGIRDWERGEGARGRKGERCQRKVMNFAIFK